MARTHSPSLLGFNGSSEWQRQLKRGSGVIFIGLAREASRWKRFPEKVVPSDEPMVSPAKRRIIRSLIASNMAIEPKKPRQCTDAIHQRPVGSSSAEDFTLGAVLHDLN
jgi:hypothetical protein